MSNPKNSSRSATILVRDPSLPLSSNKHLLRWIQKMFTLTQPDTVHWVDGSEEENEALCQLMVEGGTFIKLKPGIKPEAASAELQTYFKEFAKQTPDHFPKEYKELAIQNLSYWVLHNIRSTLYLLFGAGYAPGIGAGFFAGYLAYDMIHYYIHHFRARGPLGRMLRERHMRHHFQDDTRGFGISAPYWDEVFRTSSRGRSPRPLPPVPATSTATVTSEQSKP